MSWFRVLIFCLALSACGFEPLHGAKTVQASQRPAIEVAGIPDRDGQYLRNRLIDLLNSSGRPSEALWQLKVSPLEKSIVSFGIRKDATATRAQIQMTAQMQLIEKATGRILLERPLKAVSAYNLLDNQLATITSQQNVTESMLQAMSDDAVMQLDLYLRRTKEK